MKFDEGEPERNGLRKEREREREREREESEGERESSVQDGCQVNRNKCKGM